MAAKNAISLLALAVSLLVAYVTAADHFVKFGYTDSIGPQNWGSLSSDYQLCAKGQNQSPININKNETVHNPDLPTLQRDFSSSTNATLIDNGFNIALRFGSSVGQLSLDGKNYNLIQMIWHSPSEHTINGERFPVEAQLVHRSNDGEISIIAILYKYGKQDSFLYQLKQKIAELAEESCSDDEESHLQISYVSTRALSRNTRKYYKYVGSLTTPPCTEDVTWYILGKVREISEEQVEALKAPLDAKYNSNSRPTQPLNGRKVQLYDELHDGDDN